MIDSPTQATGTTQALVATGTNLVNSGLQLSLNADYTKLYGTHFCNAASNYSGYDTDTFTAQDGIVCSLRS
jgi:hypothetical protein